MNKAHSSVFNFGKICRLCLEEKRILMDIFEAVEETYSLSIYQKIKACSAINPCRGDGLPTRICVPCLSSLNAAFDFRIQCENAEKTLQDICHLLISKEIKNKKAPVMVNAIEKPEVESKRLHTNQLQFFNLNHIVVIRRQDKDFTKGKDDDDDDNNVDIKETDDDLLKVINGLQKNISDDNLINIDVEDFSSNNSLDMFSLQNNKVKKLHQISFPLEKNSVQKSFEVTLNPKEVLNGSSTKSKANKSEILKSKKSACPFCHKMLIRVNEHIRLLHQNKVYICKKQYCGAQFLTLKNLQSHQLKCYNMKKPYKCSRCFKEFHRKCNYKAHIIRHSNKKNFKCQLCDKAFVDSTGLKRHFLKHHEPKQEIFISSCCEKKFKTKEGLKQHIQKGICGVQIFQILDSKK